VRTEIADYPTALEAFLHARQGGWGAAYTQAADAATAQWQRALDAGVTVAELDAAVYERFGIVTPRGEEQP
jgi:hypothetical protein